MKSPAIDFIITPPLPREKDYFYQPLANHHKESYKPSVLSIHSLLSPEPILCDLRGGNNHVNDHNKTIKRRRTTPSQLFVLNCIFNQTPFPSTKLRAQLGTQLDMSPRTVQIWFQNRRQALRTQSHTGSKRRRSSSTSSDNSISEQQQVPASPPLSLRPPQTHSAVALPMTTTMMTPAARNITGVKIFLPPLLFPDSKNIAVSAFHHHRDYQSTSLTTMCLSSPTFTD